MADFDLPATGLRRTMAQSPVAKIDIRPTIAITHNMSSLRAGCNTMR